MALGRLFVWTASIAGILLLVVIILLIRGQLQNRAEDSAATRTRPALQTYHPTEAWVVQPALQLNYHRRTEYSGELVSKRRSSLSFEIGGRVTKVNLDTADSVEQDQVIATLDTATIETQKQQAIADLTRARAVLAELEAGPRATTIAAAVAEVEAMDAELVNLNRQLERRQRLAQNGALSESELDSIQSLVAATTKRRIAAEKRLKELEEGPRREQLDAQRAVVDGLQSQVELLELKIHQAVLKAPFPGAIVETFVDEGAVVAPGQPIVQLIGTGQLEAHIGLPLAVAERLDERGPNHRFRLHVGQRDYPATLNRILPMVDPVTQTVLAVFLLAPPELQPSESLELISGATVILQSEQVIHTSGFWVDNESLVQAQRGLWSLFAFEPETVESATLKQEIPDYDSSLSPVVGTVTKIQVEVLDSQSGRSFVRGSLAPGMWIISDGAHRLLDGQRVQVKKAPASPSIQIESVPASNRPSSNP